MKNKFVTTKIEPDALRLLRLVAALREEPHYEVIRHLLETELKRIEEEGESRV